MYPHLFGLKVLDSFVKLLDQSLLCLDALLSLRTIVSHSWVWVLYTMRTSVSPIARITMYLRPQRMFSFISLSSGASREPATRQPASCAMIAPAQMSHGLSEWMSALQTKHQR